MKKLPMVLCILLTCAVIFSSLFLPQAAFSLIDQSEEKKTDTEQAAALSEDVPQDDKLFMLARDINYGMQNAARSSDFFLKSGQEIEEKDLFEVIKREMAKLDPADSLGFFANLKIGEDKKQLAATLINIVQYDGGARAFPVWGATVSTNGMAYQLTLDAIIGRILTVDVYLSPGDYASADLSDGDNEPYGQMVQPEIQPEILVNYAAYLYYDTTETTDFYSELSGVSGFTCTPAGQKFSLAFYSTGYDWVLSPVFL